MRKLREGAPGGMPLGLSLAAGTGGTDGKDRLVRVVLANRSPTPALNARLNLVNGRGARILPAYFMPGERPGEWNVAPQALVLV